MALRQATKILKMNISNISQKKFVYSFETGNCQKIHPTRTLSGGTDRLLITPKFIALADHGSGSINDKYAQLQDSFTKKLLKIIGKFYTEQPKKYQQNPINLIASAVQSVKLEGSCALTLGMVNQDNGDVTFYYIGNNLYGIFKQKQVVMVKEYQDGFNVSKKLGYDSEYEAESGYVETIPYKQLQQNLIVIGSDGLWNNLGLDQIHYEVMGPRSFKQQKQGNQEAVGRYRQKKSLQEIAQKVSYIAALHAKRGNYESPYYKRATQMGIVVAKEGYLDDVSVIVAGIKKQIAIK